MRLEIWPMALAALMMGTASAPGAEATHPRLLFGPEELPAIRARAADRLYAAAWQGYLAQARALSETAQPIEPGREADANTPAAARARLLLGHKVGRELSRWMETLGTAYQITGENRFADKGVALLMTTAERFPVTQEWMSQGFAGGRGDFMRGLALGYDLFHAALSPEQRGRLRAVADGYVQQFLGEAQTRATWWYGVHNFNGVCGGAAGMLCLTLGDEDPAGYSSRLAACVEILERWLDTSFDAEGAYSEGVAYSQYGLSNTLLLARALRRHGGPDLCSRPTLRRLPSFYAMSLLPGEPVMDARNDSMYATADLECLILAEQAGDGLARWLYDLRGGPLMPWGLLMPAATAPQTPGAAGLPLAMHFTGRGLAVWRTGWRREDWSFSVEAGPYYPVTHNQGDKGHFTFYGGGFRWAIDPGYGNDRQNPQSRCHTLAHNSVLIDAQGQAPSGSGLGTNGRIVTFRDEPAYGYALADCTAAYRANTRGNPGPGVAFALRHTLFVRPADGLPAYAVVLDDIAKDDVPHDFTWQMLTWPGMAVTAHPGGFDIRPRSTLSGALVTTPPDSAGTGRCTWTAVVPDTGAYRVWARVRAAGAETARSDSFIVRIGDAPPVEWHMPSRREWTWGAVSHGPANEERVFDLSAGPCTVTFETRERDAQLDAVAIIPSAQAMPSDDSPPAELLRAEAAAVTPPMRCLPDTAASLRMAVRIDATAPLTLGIDRYEPADGREPASMPRLRAATKATNPRFIAVLVPLTGTDPEPQLAVDRGQTETVLRLQWAGACDSVTWPHGGTATARFERSRR